MKLYKIFKWEFWSVWVFYVPVYLYWLYLAMRARAWAFFTAANPTMEMGGFFGYSKYKILMQIPEIYRPETIFLPKYTTFEQVLEKLENSQIEFPCIIKPDKGERGFGVEKIETLAQLKTHLATYNAFDLIAQKLIDFPFEFGIMYHRMPNEMAGRITSVVQKEFLFVTGNGKNTLQELFLQNKRTTYHYEMLCKLHKENLHRILPKSETMQLISIGNHSRGTTFLDANHLINSKLELVFEGISQQISGFYFGRYDLKTESIEDLYTGRNIKIVELNGANSEPVHIYDPNFHIWVAYKDLFKHWKILWQISIQNHKNGVPYMPIGDVIRKIRETFQYRKENIS